MREDVSCCPSHKPEAPLFDVQKPRIPPDCLQSPASSSLPPLDAEQCFSGAHGFKYGACLSTGLNYPNNVKAYIMIKFFRKFERNSNGPGAGVRWRAKRNP